MATYSDLIEKSVLQEALKGPWKFVRLLKSSQPPIKNKVYATTPSMKDGAKKWNQYYHF